MSVFLSYGNNDLGHATFLAQKLSSVGIPVHYWQESKTPGADAWKSIQGWIDASDLVVVIISKDVLERASNYSQEVGWALKAGKVVIPIVEQGVDSTQLGMLAGITQIRWDGQNPQSAAEHLGPAIEKYLSERRVAIFLTLIIAGLIVWALLSKK